MPWIRGHVEHEAYIQMAESEANHWWFVGRRAVLRGLLRQLRLPAGAKILEAGAGTGGNLSLLSEFGEVSAFDAAEPARQLARRVGVEVREGACPDRIPFDGPFDLVCMLDVLEHVELDLETLVAIRSRLGDGGRLFLTVPAHPWLWGPHDEFLHHQRRYTRRQLRERAEAAGWVVERMLYFNAWLSPAAILARVWDQLRGSKESSGIRVPPWPVNRLLGAVFASEAWVVGRVPFPFGISIAAVLRPEGEVKAGR